KRVERFYSSTGYRSWKVGENLIWQSPDLNAPEAMKLWMASPPHRENLLSRSWREVGVSAVSVERGSGAFEGMTVTLVTVDFGDRDPVGPVVARVAVRPAGRDREAEAGASDTCQSPAGEDVRVAVGRDVDPHSVGRRGRLPDRAHVQAKARPREVQPDRER